MNCAMWRRSSLDQNQIGPLCKSILDDLSHLVNSKTDMALVVLGTAVRFHPAQKDRISANATYVIVHGA